MLQAKPCFSEALHYHNLAPIVQSPCVIHLSVSIYVCTSKSITVSVHVLLLYTNIYIKEENQYSHSHFAAAFGQFLCTDARDDLIQRILSFCCSTNKIILKRRKKSINNWSGARLLFFFGCIFTTTTTSCTLIDNLTFFGFM